MVGTAQVSFTGRSCIVLLRVGGGLGFDYKHLEDRVIWNRWFRESGNRSGSSWSLRMSRDAASGLNVGTRRLVVPRAWEVHPWEEAERNGWNTGSQHTTLLKAEALASQLLLSYNYSPSNRVLPAPGVLICEFVLSRPCRNLKEKCQYKITPI